MDAVIGVTAVFRYLNGSGGLYEGCVFGGGSRVGKEGVEI